MTRDDIIRMAREAASVHSDTTDFFALSPNQLEHFASLIAETERKACAGTVLDWAAKNATWPTHVGIAKDCAAAIRARGQQ